MRYSLSRGTGDFCSVLSLVFASLSAQVNFHLSNLLPYCKERRLIRPFLSIVIRTCHRFTWDLGKEWICSNSIGTVFLFVSSIAFRNNLKKFRFLLCVAPKHSHTNPRRGNLVKCSGYRTKSFVHTISQRPSEPLYNIARVCSAW
jgi:hypothetical protein